MNLYHPSEQPTVEDWTQAMRGMRDKMLRRSDWTQLPDASCDKQAWADYRQQLRDFPATWTPGPTADFPEPPA